MKSPKKILLFAVLAFFSLVGCVKENRDNCDVVSPTHSFNIDLEYRLANGADKDNTIRQDVDIISVFVYDNDGNYIKTVREHEANLPFVEKYLRINVPVDGPGDYRFIVVGDTSHEEQYSIYNGVGAGTGLADIENFRVTVNDQGTGVMKSKFVENTYIAKIYRRSNVSENETEGRVTVSEDINDVERIYAELFRNNKRVDVFVRNQSNTDESDFVEVEFIDYYNRSYNKLGVTPPDLDNTSVTELHYNEFEYLLHPGSSSSKSPWHELRYETMQLSYDKPLWAKVTIRPTLTSEPVTETIDIMQIIKDARGIDGSQIYASQRDLDYQNHHNVWITYQLNPDLVIVVSVLDWAIIPVLPVP